MPTIEKEDNSQNITIFEEYEIARKSGNLKDYYLRLFKYLDSEYSDNLPDVDVRTLIEITQEGKWDTPSGSGTAYKCQGNYISMLAGWLKIAVKDSVIEDFQLIEQLDSFYSHEFNFEQGKFTSQEEIDMMNNVLNLVIDNLSE